MKKWQYGAAGNFRKHSENFVVVAKIDFRYHSENFAKIAKICSFPLADKTTHSVFILFYFYLSYIL